MPRSDRAAAISSPGGHGVGLAAVAVDDEHLRAVIGELGGKAAVGESIGIQLRTGGVFQIYAVDHGVPLGGGRSGGLGGDTVVGKGQAVGEGGSCGGGRIRRLRGHRLRRISGHTGGQQSCHSAAACQQQGGLGQRHHRDGGQGVQTEEVPQLPAQRLLGQAAALPQLLEGCGGRIAPGGDGGGPQSQRRQQQGQESAYMDLFHWYHLTDKPMR